MIKTIKLKFLKLTPENSSLLIPIFIGIGFSLLLYSSLTIFLLNKREKTNTLLKEVFNKRDNLVLVENNLKKIKSELQEANFKKKNLIKIVGGTNDLNTLLAQINKLTTSNLIKVLSIKPDSIIKYNPNEVGNEPLVKDTTNVLENYDPTAPRLNANSQTGPSSINSQYGLPSNVHPLLVPNLEKHQVNIKLEAKFEQILNFLRDIELLENIVLVNDMNILRSNDVYKTSESSITINIEITAYGKSHDKQ